MKNLLQMKLILPLTLVMVIGASCSLLWEYREIHELDEWRWYAANDEVFEYETSAPKQLNAKFLFRHVHGFAPSSIQIECHIENANGMMDTTFTVPIKDKNGDYVGSGSVDLWDIEYPFLTSYPFPAGKTTFRFQQSSEDPLTLAMEVGLLLEE